MGATGSPVPDLVVLSEQSREPAARDRLDARDEIAALEAALTEVFLDDVDLDAFGDQLGDVLVDPGRPGLPSLPEGEAGGVLTLHRVVDRVPPEQHVELRPGALERVGQPDDRVVLLLERGPVGGGDDAQGLLRHRPRLTAWG